MRSENQLPCRSCTSRSSGVTVSIDLVISCSRSGQSMFGLMWPIGRPMSSGHQVQDALGHRREAADAQVARDDDDRDLDAAEQVHEVAVDPAELVVAAVQLLVHRVELLVGRLQLLLGGVELLVGRLQLLVARQDLLVGGLQLLVRGFELLDDRLQDTRGWSPAPLSRETCWLHPVDRDGRPIRRGHAGAPASPRRSRVTPSNSTRKCGRVHAGERVRPRRRPRASPPFDLTRTCFLRTAAALARGLCSAARSPWSNPSRAIFRRLMLGSPGAGSRNTPVCPRNWTICRSSSTITPGGA